MQFQTCWSPAANCTAVPKKQYCSSSQSGPAAAPLGKTNAWQTCCWSKVTLPFPQILGSEKLVPQTMPSPQPAHGDDNFTWALTTFYSSSSSSRRSNPQYSQHGNKRQPDIPNKLETKKTPRTTIKTHTDVWSQLPTDYTDLPLQAGTNSAQWSLALSCSRGTTGRRTSSLCLDKNGISQVDQGEQKKCFCHNPRKKSGLKCSNLFFGHTTICWIQKFSSCLILSCQYISHTLKIFFPSFQRGWCKATFRNCNWLSIYSGEKKFFYKLQNKQDYFLFSCF